MSAGAVGVSFATAPARLVTGFRKRGAVGIVSPGYGTEKVSYGLSPAGYTFHKLAKVPLQRLERHGTFWQHTPLLFDYPVELVHTFNELPCGMRPFVVTFENELPRYLGDPPAWQLDTGYRLIASPRCRQVLALSEAAADALRQRLKARGLDEQIGKVSVFRGSVLAPPAIEAQAARRRRTAGEPLRALFVGRDSLRKGLPPTLDALDDCVAAGAPVQATIVCDFDAQTYIGQWRQEDTDRTVERLRRMPGVTYHERLPNRDVHALMRSHDVLIFPTLDESLGWVAVEAALAGMPVISTDIFALPELVRHGETGILIPLDKNEARRWSGLWLSGAAFDAALARAFATLRQGIVGALLGFVSRPDDARAMGEAARRHMTMLYDFDSARRRLGDIYAAALRQ